MEMDEKPLGTAGGKGMEFDEKPIGFGSMKMDFSDAYPPGKMNNMIGYNASKEEEDDKPKEKLPLQVRIKSTVFKNRKEALEEILELYKSTEDINDGIFSEYISLFPKFVSDSNPACLEKGVQAVQCWCERVDSLSSLSEPLEFVKAIAEKALPNGKALILEACYEIYSIMIEKGLKDDVLNALKMCFSHKNQKVQCCSIEAVLELLKRFGARKLDHLKIFFPEISKLCESTISSVKALCMTFFKEAFKWVGDVVKTFTDKMKKQQLDELDKFYADYKPDEPIKPSRQSALLEEQELNKGGKGKAGIKIDAYEMATAQDIFTKYNESWADKVLATQKWSEKKELLDQLIKAASVPKLVPNNYFSIVQMCKKLLNDANVQVQICVIKIAGLLAAGIRKPFQQSAKLLSSQLVEKFKDKKQPIVDEALKSLKSFFYSLTLEDLSEDIREALGDKNAGSKVNAINLLLSCIEDEKYKQTFKTFFQLFKKLLDDSVEEVRNKTIVLVGKLKGYYTDSYTQTITLNINAQKMAKIDSYAAQVAPFQTTDPSQFNQGFSEHQSSPPKPNFLKKQQGAASTSSNPAILTKTAKTVGGNTHNGNTSNNQNKNITKSNSMEIENESGNSWNPSSKADISKDMERALIKISEPKQQSKKEGLDLLESILQQSNNKISPNGLFELVNALKKCLSESNKSLVRQFISFIAKFGEALGKEAKQFAKILIPGIMQNLSDKQILVRTEALNTLDKWSELIGLEQVINYIPPFMGFESLEIRNQLMQYAIKNQESYLRSDLKTFVIPILQCLTDKNKEIRVLAEQMMEITLKVFPISHFYDSVKDFKPAVVQQLRLIFERLSDTNKQQSNQQQYDAVQISDQSWNNNVPSNQYQNGINGNNNPSINSQSSNDYGSYKNNSQPIKKIVTQPTQQQQQPQSTQSLKEDRIQREQLSHWPLNRIDDELVEELIESVRQVGIPQDLRLKMFSYDSDHMLEAANFVKDKISNASQISDILIKWAFLRFWDQKSISVCKILLEMLKEIFECLKGESYQLQEFEIQISLGAMLLAMKTHPKNTEVLQLIHSAHERLRFISTPNKIVQFWVHRLQENSGPCEMILLVLNSGLFSQELSKELRTLSRIPSVSKNTDILTALLNTYGSQTMIGYGFDLSPLKTKQPEHTDSIIAPSKETTDNNKTMDKQTEQEDEWVIEMKQNIHKLMDKNINLKLYTVDYFNEQFSNPQQITLLSENSDYLILELTKYLSICMHELKQGEIQYEFFNNFITLFIKIINTRQFFASISLISAKNLSETILNELIQADESKQYNLALRQLNTLMLRVLENTNINSMFQILFDLLILNRKKSEYSKVIAIIIKCILKLTKVLREFLKEVDIKQLFLRFHEYIQEFGGDAQKTDEMGIKAIKTMISEISKIIELPTLMDNYKIIEGKDQVIIKMIESIESAKAIQHSPLIKSTPQAQNMDKVSQLKLRYAQIITNNKSPGMDDETIQRSLQKINEIKQTQISDENHNNSNQTRNNQQFNALNQLQNDQIINNTRIEQAGTIEQNISVQRMQN